MQDNIVHLSLEQLHLDFLELKKQLVDELVALPEKIATATPKPKELTELNVKVLNPENFDGKVSVQNEIKSEITNLNQIIEPLTNVKNAIVENATKEVSVKTPIIVKDLEKLSDLLTKLLEKNTKVVVKAPDVNLDIPNSVSINNWPTRPKEAIPVRLTDGDRFINQLTQVIKSGGGGRVTPYQTADGEASFVTLEADKSIPVTVKNDLSINTSGLATESKQTDTITALGNLITTSAFQARIPTNGQKTKSASLPVVLASDQVVSVSDDKIKPTDAYSLIQFDDTSNTSYEYYAYMDKDSNWYIKRLTTATNLFEFIAGSSSYTTAWTNRASQTYATYGSTF